MVTHGSLKAIDILDKLQGKAKESSRYCRACPPDCFLFVVNQASPTSGSSGPMPLMACLCWRRLCDPQYWYVQHCAFRGHGNR